MNIFKNLQNWAQYLVNKWEEDEYKQRVERLRSTATLCNVNPPPTYPKPPAPPCPPRSRFFKTECCMGQETKDKPVVKEVSITLEKPKLTEPVELIIKAMQERPETFEIEYGVWELALRGKEIIVKDTLTGLALRFGVFYYQGSINACSIVCLSDKWITGEDSRAIKEQLDAIQKKQQEDERVAQDITQEQQRLKVVAMYKENV